MVNDFNHPNDREIKIYSGCLMNPLMHIFHQDDLSDLNDPNEFNDPNVVHL